MRVTQYNAIQSTTTLTIIWSSIMKRSLFLVMLVVAGVSVSTAQVKFGGGGQAGLAIASFPEPMNNVYGFGYGFGGHANLGLIEAFAVRMNVDYTMFPSDKDYIKNNWLAGDPNVISESNVSGLNASVIAITLNAIGKVPTGSNVRPYGLFGMGLHITNVSDLKVVHQGRTLLTATGDGNETNFGLNFGMGTEFDLGSVRMNVEAKYVLMLTENNSSGYFPFTIGVTF